MGIRKIRTKEDEVLRKISKKVEVIDQRICTLLDDMADTMHKAEGVGLAAPQIGILKRVVVIDIGEGLIEMINPVIIFEKGEQTGDEGCLSLPGQEGEVTRPMNVIVRAQNRKGETIEVKGKELLARAICHEVDHLNGILFMDKVIPGTEVI